jgi:hypothetical protein
VEEQQKPHRIDLKRALCLILKRHFQTNLIEKKISHQIKIDTEITVPINPRAKKRSLTNVEAHRPGPLRVSIDVVTFTDLNGPCKMIWLSADLNMRTGLRSVESIGHWGQNSAENISNAKSAIRLTAICRVPFAPEACGMAVA